MIRYHFLSVSGVITLYDSRIMTCVNMLQDAMTHLSVPCLANSAVIYLRLKFILIFTMCRQQVISVTINGFLDFVHHPEF
jgi:hypothetical protein